MLTTYLKDECVEEESQKEESEGEIDSNLEMPCTNRRFKTPYAAGVVFAAGIHRFHVVKECERERGKINEKVFFFISSCLKEREREREIRCTL